MNHLSFKRSITKTVSNTGKNIIICLLLLIIISCDDEKKAFELIEVPVRDIIPEGIIYDHKTQTFYLSSLHKHKIISYSTRSEKVKDFIPSGFDDFGIGVGMKITEDKNELIALSSSSDNSMPTSYVHFIDMSS